MADKFWRPRAGAIPHIVTITFTGTPVLGDTVSVTINDSTLTMTVGDAIATTDVAVAFEAAWNALNRTGPLVGTESRNVGGQQLPEFATISALASSNTVVLTAKTIGVPFTVSTAKTGTVAIASAVTQTATSPNHVDAAENWSGGTLPGAGDRMVFDQGTVDAKYGLDYYRTNTLDVSVLVTGDYGGGIGLPWWNAAGYQEYQERFLQLYDIAGARSIDIVDGQNGGIIRRPLRFDLQGQTWDEVRVLGGFNGTANPAGLVEVHGGSVDLLVINEGWVSTDPDDAEQTAGMTVDKVVIGKSNGSVSSPRAVVGRLTDWNASDTPVDVLGGLVDVHCLLDQGGPEATPLVITGGIVRALADGDIHDVTVKAGRFEWPGNGTSNGTLEIWTDGTLDMRGDGRAKTFNAVNAYRDAKIYIGRQTPTITPQGCYLENINISR